MSSDAASRRIGAFIQRFGPAHLALACHAAFPLALTPDLLYRLWAHFQLDAQGAPLRVPWVAVADLLLSGMCREVGHELYELDPAVRAALLRELRDSPRFGQPRIAELGRFLLEYVGQLLLSDSPDERDFAESQQWTALAYVRPDEAVRRLAQAAARAAEAGRAERVRLRALIETFEAPLGEHAEFAALLAGMRAEVRPPQAPQPSRGVPRRKTNLRAAKAPTQETPEQSDVAPLCVLAIISAPTNPDDRDLARVDAEREWADLRSNLAPLDPAVFALDRLDPPTLERLRSQLAQADYDVIHFVGHIEIDQEDANWNVVLQDEQGRASELDGQEFTAMLGRHAALRLVVLNVAEVDPELGNDLFLRAVQIAMHEPVAAVLLVPPGAREATRAFNTLFYTALAQQQPIEQALDTANHAARQTGAAWAEPTLFSRTPDGSITSTTLANADDDQTPQLVAQRDALRRRLQQLERQRALYGIDLPSRVVTDIQDTQRALAAIEARLAGGAPPEQKPVPNTPADEQTQELLDQRDQLRRRLRALELQQAYYGVNVPAEIIVEAEDTQRALSASNALLAAIDQALADGPNTLDAAAIEHLQQLRLTKLRRLRIREQQKAMLDIHADAIVDDELNELRAEIAQIEGRLADTGIPLAEPATPIPTPPGPLGDEERANLAELRHTTQRRLQEREKQRAYMGDAWARPEILMEVEDLQARLRDLDSQLGGEPPPGPESREQLLKLAEIKQRRLRVIEEMIAVQGLHAPSNYVQERDDLRAEIAQLEQQLRDAGVELVVSNIIPTPTPATEQQAAPTLDPGERAPLEAQYRMIERRLKIRERQQALLGLDTPPEVATEIEDLRKQMADLAGRLGGAPPLPPEKQSPELASPERRPLLEQQRRANVQRLRPLEEQRARYGEARVPPEIVIQIEDLREEIDYLDRQLGIAAEALAAQETGQRAALEQLRAIRMQRLRLLEEQAARYSADFVPVSITVEIEDLRNEIADLDRALSAAAQEPANVQNTTSATTRWGTLRLSAAIDGQASGEPLRAGQVYMLQVGLQLAPTEIAQVHSQASGDTGQIELRIAIETTDAMTVTQPEKRVRLAPGGSQLMVAFSIQPNHAGQTMLVVNAATEGTLLLTQPLSFKVEDAPLAEQQALSSNNAPFAPAQAPVESAQERSSQLDVDVGVYQGSERLSIGPDRTYKLTISEQYTLQVSVQLNSSLTEDSTAMNLGELPLQRRIVVQAHNLIVEGEHQQQVDFVIGGPWAKANFILRPLTAGAATVIASTYDGEALEDQQRLAIEVLAAPKTHA